MQGQDVEADILVTLEEALNGSTRQISFRRGASGKIQTYTVKIPKGVREGQRIRLAGLGESGGGGGQAGDLYLRVKLEKHPDFEVQGSDLFYDLEIPAWQAVLGGDVEIPLSREGRNCMCLPVHKMARSFASRAVVFRGRKEVGETSTPFSRDSPARGGQSRKGALETNCFPARKR